MPATKKRIVILGGGFAGVYTAQALEKLLKGQSDFEVVLVSRENYMVYQPMLAEVVSGSVGLMDTITPLRQLIPKTRVYVRDVESVDTEAKTVTLSQGVRPIPTVLSYDYLVLALGNVTDFRGMAGMPQHALPFKNLADAVQLRNHVIYILEQAAVEQDDDLRKRMLTFVVAGGGFSGTEIAGELNDFVRNSAKSYGLNPAELQVILVHSGGRVLERELSESLSKYATEILQKRGVKLILKTTLVAASPEEAVLKDGTRIPTKTLISTVPSSPNPVVEKLPQTWLNRGKVVADLGLQVKDTLDVWAVGDCAAIPNPADPKGICPPTAQFAIQEAKVTAHNIVAGLRGGAKKQLTFTGLGKMGLLGHHCAVAELPGNIKLQGFLAWFMWRGVYWMKLPRLSTRIKVALGWLGDVLIPEQETAQLKLGSNKAVVQAHYEPGDVVFREGDLGDSLYIILSGRAEVVKKLDGAEKVVAELEAGKYFGEMALMNQPRRTATIRAKDQMDVLVLNKNDFTQLVNSLPDLRASFSHMAEQRASNLAQQVGAGSNDSG